MLAAPLPARVDRTAPRPARLHVAALFALVVSMLLLPASGFGATNQVRKSFGGPLAAGATAAPGGGCSPDGTATKTDAAEYTDFCVAFRTYETSARTESTPADGDLKSVVVDTPQGFAAAADAYPQCTNAQFAADSEDDVTCPANTQMGEASADIRAQLQNGLLVAALAAAGQEEDGNAKLVAPGRIFNLEHTENEVARLGIILDPSGAGIPQPKVKIVVRVTLRPAPDVGLRSIIDNIPQTAHVKATLPLIGGFDEVDQLAVDEFRLIFYGPQRGSMARTFAFMGANCGNTQTTNIRGTGYDGTPSRSSSVTYRLTDCEDPNIPFLPGVAFSTTENRPDVTTETTVSVLFGDSPNAAYQAAGPKRVAVTLPQGLSFSAQIASGANGLPVCTPEQFGQTRAEASVCPAATAVGTVSFRSPVQTRILNGQVFLGSQPVPKELPDIYIEAQEGPASDAPRVKLIAHLSIDGSNRIVATLDDLPEVPVNEFRLNFRGGDQAAVVTPPTCGTFAGGLATNPYNRPTTPVDTPASYSVTADCDAVKAFNPSVSFAVDDTTALARSPLTTVVSRPDRSPRLARTVINLPPGAVANLKGVPECSQADAAAGACPASTRVGSVTGIAGVGPAPFRAPGDVYLVARQSGAAAGLSFRVPIVFGQVDLGVLNVGARVEIRPDDLGLRVVADVPERFKGIPLNIRSLAIKLDRPNFAQNGTNCSLLTTLSPITSNTGVTANASASLQYTNCRALPFGPTIAAAVSGQTGPLGRPIVQVRITNEAGSSALRQAFVTLPRGLAFDLRQTARSCLPERFRASNCPPVAKIGSVSGALTIADDPLAGDLYLLRPAGNGDLPGLGLAFTGRFAGNVAGRTQVDRVTKQLVTRFESIPDLPLSSFQLDVTGGPGAALVANKTLCKVRSVTFNARFVAQGTQSVDRRVDTFCGSKLDALAPTVGGTLRNLRTGRPSLSLELRSPAGGPSGQAMKMTQVDLQAPAGYVVSRTLAGSKRGVSVQKLSLRGASSSTRIDSRTLRVKLPSAGSTKASIAIRGGALTVASAGLRRSRAKQDFSLRITYAGGETATLPLRLAPR